MITFLQNTNKFLEQITNEIIQVSSKLSQEELNKLKLKYNSIQKLRAELESQVIKKSANLMGKFVESMEQFTSKIEENILKEKIYQNKLFINITKVLIKYLDEQMKEEATTNLIQQKIQFYQMYKLYVSKCQSKIYLCCGTLLKRYFEIQSQISKSAFIKTSELMHDGELII